MASPIATFVSGSLLDPLDLGVGRFPGSLLFASPIRCSGALLVTDALVGISVEPPALFDLDPTPLLFHARERGDEPLNDSPDARRRGWARLVLFASYLRPEPLEVPGLKALLGDAFKPGLRSLKAHFGLYPFRWKPGWRSRCPALMGDDEPCLQVAPVLERLVLPRAQTAMLQWLDQLSTQADLRWLVPAHYSAPLVFDQKRIQQLKVELTERSWASSSDNWEFLGSIDRRLLQLGVASSINPDQNDQRLSSSSGSIAI